MTYMPNFVLNETWIDAFRCDSQQVFAPWEVLRSNLPVTSIIVCRQTLRCPHYVATVKTPFLYVANLGFANVNLGFLCWGFVPICCVECFSHVLVCCIGMLSVSFPDTAIFFDLSCDVHQRPFLIPYNMRCLLNSKLALVGISTFSKCRYILS